MKKLAAVILSLSMVLALAACGGASQEAATTAAAGGEKSGQLVMATNAEFPPYEFKEGDSFAGIDVEIAQTLADKLGLELVINDVEFGSIIGGIETGKYDVGLAGMTVTEDRLKSVNFSTSYATGIQSIIVPENSDIKSPDDLAGKKNGVQESTTGDIYCCDDFGDENVTAFKTGADAVQALIAGKVDAVVIDNQPAISYVEAEKDSNLQILETAYAEEEYAIAVGKDKTELLDNINAALAEMEKDGTLAEIVAKYIN